MRVKISSKITWNCGDTWTDDGLKTSTMFPVCVGDLPTQNLILVFGFHLSKIFEDVWTLLSSTCTGQPQVCWSRRIISALVALNFWRGLRLEESIVKVFSKCITSETAKVQSMCVMASAQNLFAFSRTMQQRTVIFPTCLSMTPFYPWPNPTEGNSLIAFIELIF